MGLAYNLDVKYWDNVSTYLSEAFVLGANEKNRGGRGDLFDIVPNGGYFGYWTDGTGVPGCQAIFPTGEYIIRDAIFQNGMYVFCGSYKAYFKDLYGAGNDGYAWDGFIMVLRGYSNETFTSVPFRFNKDTKALEEVNYGGNSFGIIPMRMPLDIQPSAIGDAVATAADDSVGLQGIEVYKNADAPILKPGGAGAGGFTWVNEANLKIITVGFQLVGDPVAQQMQFSDIDYVGFLMYGTLLRYGDGIRDDPFYINANDGQSTVITIDNETVYLGGTDLPSLAGGYTQEQLDNTQSGSYIKYEGLACDMFKVSWRASANNSLPVFPVGDPNVIANLNLRPLDTWLSVSTAATNVGGQYDPGLWRLGVQPDGNNPSNGNFDPNVNASAQAHDYFPRRFMDVTAFSQTKITEITVQDSCFMISGDCSVGLDLLGNAVTTVPMCVGGFYPYSFIEAYLFLEGTLFPDPTEPLVYLGPYLLAHIAGLSAEGQTGIGIAQNLWTFPATMAPVSTFDGAYAAFSVVPYEFMGPNFVTNEFSAICHVAVNGVVDGDGGTNSALFASIAEVSIIAITDFQCVGVSGSVVSEAQIKMPTKWIGKAMQSRTFSVQEESYAKGQIPEIVEFPEQTDGYSIKNANNGGELIGWRGNYQRYGLDGDVATQELETISPKGQGTATRQGYGFLGYTTGEGPYLVMFDSGRGLYTDPLTVPPTAIPNYSNVILSEGEDLNRNTLPVTDPLNTTRMAVNCAWDNDRDQWLFCEQDPTLGTSIISVNSGFSASSNNNGYLDQTNNFGGAPVGFRLTDCHSSMFVPFLMTNNLDGVVLTGGDDSTSSGTGTQFGNTGLTAYGCHSINNGTPVATTEPALGPCAAKTWNVQPTLLPFYTISGSTGRVAKVWVDYVLFDGADALIATKLRERGMKVTIEAVEWFKRKIINKGDLNIKQEEIEMWMRDQQDEFKQMMQTAERQGRVRKRKSQVSAYGLDLSEVISPDFEDKEVQEFMKDYLPQSRPPTPEEQRLEKQRKGGYSPEQNSYFDEIFEE